MSHLSLLSRVSFLDSRSSLFSSWLLRSVAGKRDFGIDVGDVRFFGRPIVRRVPGLSVSRGWVIRRSLSSRKDPPLYVTGPASPSRAPCAFPAANLVRALEEPGNRFGDSEERGCAARSCDSDGASGGEGGRSGGYADAVRSMTIRSPVGDWIGSSNAASIVDGYSSSARSWHCLCCCCCYIDCFVCCARQPARGDGSTVLVCYSSPSTTHRSRWDNGMCRSWDWCQNNWHAVSYRVVRESLVLDRSCRKRKE